MQINMKRYRVALFVMAMSVCALLMLSPHGAQAQTQGGYPEKPVKIIVANPPGGRSM